MVNVTVIIMIFSHQKINLHERACSVSLLILVYVYITYIVTYQLSCICDSLQIYFVIKTTVIEYISHVHMCFRKLEYSLLQIYMLLH